MRDGAGQTNSRCKAVGERRATLRRIAGFTLSAQAAAALDPAFAQTCAPTPDSIAGPFPADGIHTNLGNTPNALAMRGIVRADIRASLLPPNRGAAGVPLALHIRVVDRADACRPIAGVAVYVWHCDSRGRYSMYSNGLIGETFLRGVQLTDQDGWVRYSTIFPGCYPSVMTHVHYEVFRDLNAATSSAKPIKTSMFAMPHEACNDVYRKANEYSSSARRLARMDATSDQFFADGTLRQVAEVSGALPDGLQAKFQVALTGG